MAELEEIFSKLIHILEESSINYVIVGGFAAIIRGSPRTTSDIGIILQNMLDLADRLITIFDKAGFEVMENQLRMAIEERYIASIFMPNSVIRVDLKVATSHDEKEVLKQSVEENIVFGGYFGS